LINGNAKKIIVANWKMNGAFLDIDTLLENTNTIYNDLILCLPFTMLYYAHSKITNSAIFLGAQNIHHKEIGSYTGSISARMVKEVGCKYVLIGHSERRNYNNDTNEIIKLKVKTALDNILLPIICIGESDIRNKEEQILFQLENLFEFSSEIIVAYEPIWAIGGDKIPSIEEILRSVMIIRKSLGKKVPILYGGSVDENNYKPIISLDEISGILVGRVSLDFTKLVNMLNYKI